MIALPIDATLFFVLIVVFVGVAGTIWLRITGEDRYYFNGLIPGLFWATVLMLVIWGGLLKGIRGLTPGKVMAGLKVVSADDHNQTIGFARGIAREVIRTFPIMPTLYFTFLPSKI